MTWGMQNSEEEAHQQLSCAWDDYGINFLDTAEIYPVPPAQETQGRTEQYIGSWLKGRKRDSVVLATKVCSCVEGVARPRPCGQQPLLLPAASCRGCLCAIARHPLASSHCAGQRLWAAELAAGWRQVPACRCRQGGHAGGATHAALQQSRGQMQTRLKYRLATWMCWAGCRGWPASISSACAANIEEALNKSLARLGTDHV